MSALIALFAFLLLLERTLHLALLYSMLPRRMVKQLHGDGGGGGSGGGSGAGAAAESYEHVVVLFSDIVSYTDLVGTLTPRQTMRMLDSLFEDFDALVDKHRIVIKIETS